MCNLLIILKYSYFLNVYVTKHRSVLSVMGNSYLSVMVIYKMCSSFLYASLMCKHEPFVMSVMSDSEGMLITFGRCIHPVLLRYYETSPWHLATAEVSTL